MTPEDFSRKIDNLSRFLTYPELDDLHALVDHDQEQREEIASSQHCYNLLEERRTQLQAALAEKDREITNLRKCQCEGCD